VLRNVEYVRGVRVNGTFAARRSTARLRVSGSGARGHPDVQPPGPLTGRLGGPDDPAAPRRRATAAAPRAARLDRLRGARAAGDLRRAATP
jgi:hypothetical protein